MSEVGCSGARARGRPPTRSDDETRHLIAQAARREFMTRGYAGTCMDDVAKGAGVSKKTLYRLVPAKADLFRTTVSDRIAQFLAATDEETIATPDVALGLERHLTELGNLTLAADTISTFKLALAEADRFPELAANFYTDAVVKTQAVLSRFLARQCEMGVLELDDPVAAAGMLRGMMMMEPQRAAMLAGVALPTPAETRERARACVRLFLRGCRKDRDEAPAVAPPGPER